MRWTLSDPATSETWAMPINPDAMTSPFPGKSIVTAYGSRRGRRRPRTVMTPPPIVEWEWEGVIRTEAHYDQLHTWATKGREVHVTDHLGRTWEVLLQAFIPEDRKPTPQTPWRMRYSMRSLILRRVA